MGKAPKKRSSAWPLRSAYLSTETSISAEARQKIEQVLGLPLSDFSYRRLETHLAHLIEELGRPDPRELCKELKLVKRGEDPLTQEHWREVVGLLDTEKRKAGPGGYRLRNEELAGLALSRLKKRANPLVVVEGSEELTTPVGNRAEPMRDWLIIIAAKALLEIGIEPKVGRSGSNNSHYGSLVDLLTVLYEKVPALKRFADLDSNHLPPERETSADRSYYRLNVIRRAQRMYEEGQFARLDADAGSSVRR
jgi:hypothetical protein